MLETLTTIADVVFSIYLGNSVMSMQQWMLSLSREFVVDAVVVIFVSLRRR